MLENLKKIAIVRTDKIGDLVLTLPLAKVIKENYPDSEITFVIQNYTKALVENHPYIDHLYILDNKISEFSDYLKKEQFDAILIVRPELKIAVASFLARIKYRIGTGYRYYSVLFNHRIYEHRKLALKNELEYNFDLLKPLGINFVPNYNNIVFDIPLNPSSNTILDNYFYDKKIDKSKVNIVIHPGSAGSSVDLPLQKMNQIVEYLSRKNINIFLTGNSSEYSLCSKLENGINTYNVAGKFDLSVLISLINPSKLLVANSTGPLHIAAALGKNVVSFFPKIRECSPQRWSPYTMKKNIFQPKCNEKKCTLSTCKKNNCMETIDVNEVCKTIDGILWD